MNRRLASFAFAFAGIVASLRSEWNFRFHCFAALFVIIFASVLRVSLIEWAMLLLAIAMVMTAELLNTAIECTVDLISPDRTPLAKQAKDAAAGAVLIAAIFAAAIGLLILVPRLF